MEKTFFCHGLESGIRLRTAAKGYERRNDVMSLSSSTEPPVALAKGMKAGRGQQKLWWSRVAYVYQYRAASCRPASNVILLEGEGKSLPDCGGM